MRVYAAYGSNLHIQQMKERCPDSRVIAKGFIKGYELEFRVVATIKPSPGKLVPVVLWSISERDEIALDRYEGVASGLYRKEILKVTVEHWAKRINLETQEINAMVYIMNTDDSRPVAPPPTAYYKTIREGYLQNGLEPTTLATALDLSKARIDLDSDDCLEESEKNDS